MQIYTSVTCSDQLVYRK